MTRKHQSFIDHQEHLDSQIQSGGKYQRREWPHGTVEMPFLLTSPPPPPPCHPTKTSSNLPSFSISAFPTKPVSINSGHNNGFPYLSHVRTSKTTADMDEAEEERAVFTKLRQKMDSREVKIDSCTPGLYDLLVCPKCNGGQSMQRSLSFHVGQNWSYAMWRCFDTRCGWAGQVVTNSGKPFPGGNLHGQINSNSPSTRESLRLEVLGEELVDYFAGRMISKETLQRNKVMQVSGEKDRGTEKMLYGLDDITEADEIIIVEGEIDKLSIEEAGYYNCASVPGGAPQTVSIKELPSVDKDVSFQYLWNCKDYLDKASRIILATDGDIPGQALAEELSRRLGRERCWQVNWPEKDELSSFKDANEVLKNLGAAALRDAINGAKPYESHDFS
ncbi:primase homolog protein isoform X2 [Primulina huaijiensis]|uniref:primase homolog protein isoform X2 n=1 Tax=Primulina huaijiensis TaxID=1492673 RepID=UPI003CC7832D